MRIVVASALLVLCSVCSAWDAHGHRVVTLMALDGLVTTDRPTQGGAAPAPGLVLPGWLMSVDVREQAAYQAAEPDRIRAQPTPSLVHVNGPDHYLDLDMLPRWGMTMETMPTLRHRFIKELTLAREKHPENFLDYDPTKDPSNEHEWPGLAAQAVMESYGHLQASFRTLKIIDFVGAQGRDNQIAAAKANAIYHIGRLSHFVGDLAQPLHTTIHHHGWVGPPEENPEGFTTDPAIHAYIDGTILVHHGITYESLRERRVAAITVNDMDPWKDVLAHIVRSHEQVVPLYRMHKDDSLRAEAGKQFIESRLLDGADMLRAMISAAWTSSDPTKRDIEYFTSGTPAADRPSLPEMGNRQIPAKSAAEFEVKQKEREERRKARDAGPSKDSAPGT